VTETVTAAPTAIDRLPARNGSSDRFIIGI
jgi:hypothetical protein